MLNLELLKNKYMKFFKEANEGQGSSCISWFFGSSIDVLLELKN